jgi:AP-1 complex subunit mu
MPLILDMEEENVPITPCFSSEGINYMHIRHNNLYCAWLPWLPNRSANARALSIAVVALSKRNSNAVEIILFLHRLCAVR